MIVFKHYHKSRQLMNESVFIKDTTHSGTLERCIYDDYIVFVLYMTKGMECVATHHYKSPFCFLLRAMSAGHGWSWEGQIQIVFIEAKPILLLKILKSWTLKVGKLVSWTTNTCNPYLLQNLVTFSQEVRWMFHLHATREPQTSVIIQRASSWSRYTW